MRGLWVLMALALAVPAGAQLAVDVTDSGAVNIDVGGARCPDSFRVILPAPGWKGGAGPSDCTRETLGPGHVRVRGQMTDGRPCASLTLDAQETDGAVELTWESRFSRDLDVETVRLNGYLPCAESACKAAWFISRTQTPVARRHNAAQ